MIIYQGDAAGWGPIPGGSAVAIGVFDGVHLGHKRVLEAIGRQDRGCARVAMTFGTHPAAVLAPGSNPTRLSTLKRRFELFEAAGIQRVAVLNFDASLRDLTPESFVERFLVDGLNARFVAVGEGFRFGRGASGTTMKLAELGERYGFNVDVVELAAHDGLEIRSTLIRRRMCHVALVLYVSPKNLRELGCSAEIVLLWEGKAGHENFRRSVNLSHHS